MEYAAFLGHLPAISIAELSAAIEDFSLNQIIDDRIAIFETSQDLDQEFLDTLGGTVIIAQRITDADVALDDIPKIIYNEVQSKRGKVTFSLRAINVPKPMVRSLYRRCKIKFKESGRGCRYVGNEKKPAATVVLHENDLIDGKDGCELTIIAIQEENGRTLWVGRTIAAQDIDWYSYRDMEKPVRDTTIGLLPPKLAQIMLNLGEWLIRETKNEKPETSKRKTQELLTIFDPFCGTGVIPMETLLREWNVIASDLSVKAVNGCKKNIEWIRKEEKILKKDATSEIYKHDATKDFDFKELPDVVVTETSLGPPMSSRPTLKEASKLKTQNEKLQAAFLENASKTLPGIPIVCAWPVWRQKGGWIHLDKIWKVIEKLGYKAVLPTEVKPELPNRFSIFYRRKDQFVGREIVLLIPPKVEEPEEK
ncbi:RsmD family RNA methyltransferase [Patescibacteria group bacterium]|nr:RsmD family RNA methyltransferase [Patescibacteria group bacterium]